MQTCPLVLFVWCMMHPHALCAYADYDGDHDTDLRDFAYWQNHQEEPPAQLYTERWKAAGTRMFEGPLPVMRALQDKWVTMMAAGDTHSQCCLEDAYQRDCRAAWEITGVTLVKRGGPIRTAPPQQSKSK